MYNRNRRSSKAGRQREQLQQQQWRPLEQREGETFGSVEMNVEASAVWIDGQNCGGC